MRQILALSLIATLLLASATARGQAEVGAADFTAEFSLAIGRFEGDYGLDEKTTVDLASAGLRWFLPRGEIQVSVPYVSLDGPGDIRLVGGQPVPGFQFPRGPVTPPIGGPGGGPGGEPGDGGEIVVESRRESGLGDITVQGEYYLLSGTEQRPWVIGLASVKLPTGDDERGLGTGKTDFELGLGLVQSLGQASLLADAGYTWVGGNDADGDAQLRNVVRLGAGISVPFGVGQQHDALLYFENRTNAIPDLEDQRSVSAGLGTRVGADRRIRLSGTAFLGLSDSVEDWGLFARAGYSF